MSDFNLQFTGEAEKIPFDTVALLLVGSQWYWTRNNRAKHLTIMLDTRGDRYCRVYDRENRGLTLTELAHQIEMPTPEMDPGWTNRDVPVAEMKNGMEMAARIIFAMERERRELCCEIAVLKMNAIAAEERRGPLPV